MLNKAKMALIEEEINNALDRFSHYFNEEDIEYYETYLDKMACELKERVLNAKKKEGVA